MPNIRLNGVALLSTGLWLIGLASPVMALQWKHPAGAVTDETIAEVRAKRAEQAWAQSVYDQRRTGLDRWMNISSEDLEQVFPKKRGNVYHDFSCPTDRHRLSFDPFDDKQFKCPICEATYAPGTDAGIYPPGNRYNGTMYDGWICLFHLEAGEVAADLGLVARLENSQEHARRGIELLMLYADTIQNIETDFQADRQYSRILTYHREGDNKILDALARAYELLRDRMSAEQRARFEKNVLQRMLDDVIIERIYTQNHNNLYQWHRTILQTALALEREDLIDWSFGYGQWSPENEPEHRSMRRLAATHFKEDGAYWEMCSGYHLYPLHAFCDFAVLSRNLSRMDPVRFPAERYDLTSPDCPMGEVIGRALRWFVSMAMPDRTMPTVGDSMASLAGLTDYYGTAEVGYRHYGLKAVGDYPAMREGNRTWFGLLYGSPEIVKTPTPDTSSYLSSGWVSLRNDWRGNRVWVGLNALIPGGGHQHADRLSLLMYSQGQLLALEKATPYNESTTRELGTISPSHNTVTVDKSSQPQGESLKGDQIPRVARFFAGDFTPYAELHADHLYPQTTVYRRSVALIEDICIDLFRVEGGEVHDWILHNAGEEPAFSIPMTSGTFEPKEWLYGGTDRVQAGRVKDTWSTRWRMADVTARLSMIGPQDSEVFALETYPVQNAFVTPKDPPCRTLVVRRQNDAPFLAVWDTWRDQPNLQALAPGNTRQSLSIETASHRYYLLWGPGQAHFEGKVSIESDAAFAVWRDPDGVMFAGGTTIIVTCPEGRLKLLASSPTTASVVLHEGRPSITTAGDIQYETVNGVDRPRAAAAVEIQINGDLWKLDKSQSARTAPGEQ